MTKGKNKSLRRRSVRSAFKNGAPGNKMAGRYGGRWGWGGGCTARQLGGRNNQLNSEE